MANCYSQVRELELTRPTRALSGFYLGVNGIEIDSIKLSGDTLLTYVNGDVTPFKSLYNTNNPQGSSGDIQYNNSGSFDGAPLTTDGTDISVVNNLSVGDTTKTTRLYTFGNAITYQGSTGHFFERYTAGAWETQLQLNGGMADFNNTIIKVHNQASAPTFPPIIPANGMIYYNTTSNTFEFRQNTSWYSLGTKPDSSWVSTEMESLKTFYIDLNGGTYPAAYFIDSSSFYLGDDETIFNLNYNGLYPNSFFVQKKSPYSSNYGTFKIDGNGYNMSANTNGTYPACNLIGNNNYTTINAFLDINNRAEIKVERDMTISFTNTTSSEDNSMTFDQYSLVFNYDYGATDTNYFMVDTSGVTFKDLSKQTTAMVTDGDTAFFDKSNGTEISHIKTNVFITDTAVVGDDTVTSIDNIEVIIPLTDLDSIQVDKLVGSTNPDSIYVGGSLYISKDLYVYGKSFLNKYIAHAYISTDSVATTSLSTTWAFLGGGSNNKFINDVNNGFSFDVDTLVFNQLSSDTRDSIMFFLNYDGISSTNTVNETVYNGIFVKHEGGSYVEVSSATKTTQTSTADVYYPGPICSCSVLWLKDGDKIHIRTKCESGTTTLSTTSFGITLKEN